MSYKLLRKLSYSNLDIYREEAKSRLTNPLAVKTSLKITPYMREQKIYDKKYELFYLPTQELTKLKEMLFLNSKIIIELQESLPTIAQKKVFLDNLLEEIKSTNDIEGVHSSRREIEEAIDVVLQKSEKNKRFVGIVNLYMKFQDSEYSEIKKCEDIRKIYDELLKDEIEPKKLPDGKLFRTDKVYVNKNGRPVHEGVGKNDNIEEDITKEIEILINFMNSHDITSIEKCLISHYYLEYIHPFYDGNGRLGRFIACSYLSRKLDYLSAISFSTSIKKKRGVYGTSFSEVSNPRNLGEITGFIIDMLNLLIEGQQNIIDELSEGKNLLSQIGEYLKTLDLAEEEQTIMFILAQDYLFSRFNRLEDRELWQITKRKVSKRKLKIALEKLVKTGYLVQIKQKPSIHMFSKNFIDTVNKL
ncbi:Fic family protein [Enterococcus faecium]|nr:Fic family protein [Enterococcus faecium]